MSRKPRATSDALRREMYNTPKYKLSGRQYGPMLYADPAAPTEQEWDTVLRIVQYNKKYLIGRMGEQDFCDSDANGRRIHIWKRKLPDANTMWISTSLGEGTTIRTTSGNREAIKAKLAEVFNI